MAKLSGDQKKFYENILDTSKREIDGLNEEIQKELAAVKEKITRLNAEIKAVRQIYDGACLRLGVENELAKRDGGEEASGESEEEEYNVDEELVEVPDEEEIEY